MKRIVVRVDGMMCGMCESHINDAIRRAFKEKGQLLTFQGTS